MRQHLIFTFFSKNKHLTKQPLQMPFKNVFLMRKQKNSVKFILTIILFGKRIQIKRMYCFFFESIYVMSLLFGMKFMELADVSFHKFHNGPSCQSFVILNSNTHQGEELYKPCFRSVPFLCSQIQSFGLYYSMNIYCGPQQKMNQKKRNLAHVEKIHCCSFAENSVRKF